MPLQILKLMSKEEIPCQVCVRTVTKKPGLKETNFQVHISIIGVLYTRLFIIYQMRFVKHTQLFIVSNVNLTNNKLRMVGKGCLCASLWV